MKITSCFVSQPQIADSSLVGMITSLEEQREEERKEEREEEREEEE